MVSNIINVSNFTGNLGAKAKRGCRDHATGIEPPLRSFLVLLWVLCRLNVDSIRNSTS